jgi:predicted lipid carrier protein YhbT
LVEVDEFPDALAIEVGVAGLGLSLVDGNSPSQAVARVGGDLSALLDLAEGRADGDALFFQRRIRIDGETEAVLLLRNALDGAEIDLVGDVFPPLRPLASPLRALVEIGAAGWAMIAGRESAGPRERAGR